MSYSKNIIAFDLNYSANYRFISLLSTFRENNFDLKLICEDENFLKKQEIYNGLLIKNVKGYPSQRYLEILKIENPNLVIVLGINNLKIRALNRSCKYLGIPIIVLEHGVLSVSGLTNSKRFDSKKFLIKRYKRILKGDLLKDYFFYLKNLIYTKANLKDFAFFFIESIGKLFGKDIVSEDWKYSAYCVFLESDKNHLYLQLKNSIDKKNIYVVGNYDLNYFNMSLHNFNSHNKNNNNRVLYLDSDSVNRSFNGSEENYLKYIFKINQIINKNGYKLFIKLHPNSFNNNLHLKLKKFNIISISDDDLIYYLSNSKFTISEPSSLSTLACLVGVPLITPIMYPFNKKRFGLMIDEYPNRINFSSFLELEKIIKNCRFNINNLETEIWINKYAGPLPPSEFPLRVFNIVKIFAK